METSQVQTEPTVTPALINCLIFYEYRQSRGKLTSGLKSALRLYAYQQQQINRFTQALVLEKLIESTRGQVVRVIIEAQSATPERQKELLKEARKLNKSIEKMRRQVADYI